MLYKFDYSCKKLETDDDVSKYEERWLTATESYLRIYNEKAEFEADSFPNL